jgi:FkbM family methyltransferase
MTTVLKSFSKKAIQKTFFRFGYKLIPISTASSQFPIHDSCQIPNLSKIFLEFFGDIERGSFVEVGAYDGISFSNTWGLSRLFWNGIYIEPVPKFAKQCRKNHAFNSNIKVIEQAVSSSSNQTQNIYLAGALTSTNSDRFASYSKYPWSRNHVSKDVLQTQTKTLNEILEAEGLHHGFELLVVDVEGSEPEVFEGFDIKTWKPKMIIVELEDFHPSISNQNNDLLQLRRRIEGSGYKIVYKDHINSIFINSDLYDRMLIQ